MSTPPTDPRVQGPPFECDVSLREYQVSAKDYLLEHTQYHVMCTGIAVFNEDNKLLLVQRAKTEKAFPECWV